MIFARNMPKFYTIIARKTFSPIFRGELGGTCPLSPVSYAYTTFTQNLTFHTSRNCQCLFERSQGTANSVSNAMWKIPVNDVNGVFLSKETAPYLKIGCLYTVIKSTGIENGCLRVTPLLEFLYL